MERESILEKFNDELLNSDIKLLNEFLSRFCENRKDIAKLLSYHFESIEARYDGFKTFNLERWSSFGGDSNPTLEIVKVKDKLLFGFTAYGTLGPLDSRRLNSGRRITTLNVIMDFFINPEKFFEK
ncbi:MAG: hypothetical protein WCI91_03165 [Candidatus Nomurabacteria bacterium]